MNYPPGGSSLSSSGVAEATGIRVLAVKQPMQFLMTDPPVVFIDGVRHPLMWGYETTFPLRHGEHEISIAYHYFGKQRGLATVRAVASDPPPLVRYRSPFWMWSKGYIRLA